VLAEPIDNDPSSSWHRL